MAEIRVKETGTIKLFESDNTSSVTIASPASLGADRTVTLPDANVTLASGTMLATDGSGASLTALNASELGSGTVPTARLGTGTAAGSTFLAGDNTWGAAGGGKILQVVTRNTNTTMNTTSTSPTATDMYAVITPTATSSTILVMMSFKFAIARAGASPNTTGAYNGYGVYLDKGGAGYNLISPDDDSVLSTRWAYTRDYATLPTIYLKWAPAIIFVDSPSSVAACTYKLYVERGSAGTDTYFGNNHNSDHTTLLEIDGS